MGRFRLDQNPIDQGKKQLNIVKKASISNLKARVRNVLIGGDPKDLMDPAKYISEDSKLATLLGISEKREKPKYLTPYGASATDYLVLRKQRVETVQTTSSIDYDRFDDPLILGSEGYAFNESLKEDAQSTTEIKVVDEFVDLSALVNVSQKKNILLTKVEGRDRSRKEYISGGDYMITISGLICGKQPEQYPESEVKMLIEMLESKDVLNVENPLLNRFGITGLIVLDFKFPQTKASRNQQAYQINAVFEKPVEALVAEKTEELSKLQQKLKALNEWVALDIKLDQLASNIKI